MVFSSRPPKERKEIKLFTRESSQQAKIRMTNLLGFHLIITTTGMEIKRTIFLVFVKVYLTYKKKEGK